MIPYCVEPVLKGQCHSWALASKHINSKKHLKIFQLPAILDFDVVTDQVSSISLYFEQTSLYSVPFTAVTTAITMTRGSSPVTIFSVFQPTPRPESAGVTL